MEAIVDNNKITLKGLTVQEAQQIKEALKTLKDRERWMMQGQRLHANVTMTDAIHKAQMEWARQQ